MDPKIRFATTQEEAYAFLRESILSGRYPGARA
jgi:hypothetical protein